MKNRYLLLGLGIANMALKKHFDKSKIKYIIYDDFQEQYRKDIDFNSFDCMIKSSGINDDHYLINYAKKLNKLIYSDLEYYYLISKPKTIICVTGSNGKTTVVSLIKHILEDLDLAGNIGIPLAEYLESENDLIIEASSFMLDYIQKFRAKINIITNIYINHLEHHKTLKSYIKAKLKLLKNITENDYLIYNYDNLLLRRLVGNLEVNKIPFSLLETTGVYLINNDVYYQNNLIYSLKDIKLAGKHNKYNILAAIAAIIAYDSKKLNLLNKLITFQTLEHRLEYIGSLKGIKVYNDSKSTNFKALSSALNTFKEDSILLICGGKIKESDYSLIDSELKQIKFVIIYGENRYLLGEYLQENNLEFILADDLLAALRSIKDHLDGITKILFSPGSSSYDQFRDYVERGNYFKARIRNIYELSY